MRFVYRGVPGVFRNVGFFIQVPVGSFRFRIEFRVDVSGVARAFPRHDPANKKREPVARLPVG